MDSYLVVKTLHILSSTILFGSGIAIAFFMYRSRFSTNLPEKLYAAHYTVIADFLFTLPAVIIQPLTGLWLIWHGGYQWTETWLVTTYILYIITGFCWLPVVWIQIQLKRMVSAARQNNTNLPKEYNRLFKIWFLLGWPAFLALIIIFYLMVAKPA